MTETELLTWVRGPGFQIATIIFVLGIMLRLFEILMLGRKANLAEAKGSEMSSGLRTVFFTNHTGCLNIQTLGVHGHGRLHLPYRPVRGYLPVRASYPAVQGHHRFRLAGAALDGNRRHCGRNHHYTGYRTGTPIERPGETLPQHFR